MNTFCLSIYFRSEHLQYLHPCITNSSDLIVINSKSVFTGNKRARETSNLIVFFVKLEISEFTYREELYHLWSRRHFLVPLLFMVTDINASFIKLLFWNSYKKLVRLYPCSCKTCKQNAPHSSVHQNNRPLYYIILASKCNIVRQINENLKSYFQCSTRTKRYDSS